MSKDTGGQAFPSIEETYVGEGISLKTNIEGMTLRDYFAGQALIAYRAEYVTEAAANSAGLKPWEFLAKCCYEQADAMIAERNKDGNNVQDTYSC